MKMTEFRLVPAPSGRQTLQRLNQFGEWQWVDTIEDAAFAADRLAYARGEITEDEQAKRIRAHKRRWAVERKAARAQQTPEKFQAPDTGHSEGPSIDPESEPSSAAAQTIDDDWAPWPNSYNPNSTR